MRMTARVRKIEDGVFEADYTIEPAEELTADSDYMRRFATEAEARAWLQGRLLSMRSNRPRYSGSATESRRSPGQSRLPLTDGRTESTI